ncbi:hypothetical protein [Flavobacterium sp.]
MRTNILTLTLLSLMSISLAWAQDRTTVTANNSEISDNLDLRAVASIFGESQNLDDFEDRLNNPKYQISNLDLNNDNQVDYLRVIETVQGNAHLIIIQSVLGRDQFQDIATVEVMKDSNNKVQVQVVGDVYMYGSNYIYEPAYAYTPVIYTNFWAPRYRPYYSSWYWGYYPSYYVAWHPFPIYTYRNNINVWINYNNHYNYVNHRNCTIAYNNYYRGNRGNYYETHYPNRSFTNRNNGYTNRHDLDQTRNITSGGSRGDAGNTTGTGTSRAAINNTRATAEMQNINATTTRSAGTRTTSTIGAADVQNTDRTNSTSSTVRTPQPVRAATSNTMVNDATPTRNTMNVRNEPTRSTGAQNNSNNSPTRYTPSATTNRNTTTTRTSTIQNSAPTRSSGNRGTTATRSHEVRSTGNNRSGGSNASSRGTLTSGNTRGGQRTSR